MAVFSEVFEDVTKLGHKIPKENYLDEGKYPIIDQGQTYIAGYSNNSEGLYSDVPAIIFGDHTRIIKYVDMPCFLGADGVTLDIYNIRIYNNNLTRYQVLNNWIADTQNITEMIKRYEHNDIYDEYGQVVIDKLPNDLPYFLLDAEELPQYKGHKLIISGSYIDPLYPSKSFTFTGCQINVQGTSSAPYPRKNYDMQFKNGFEIQGEHADNYMLADGIIPFNRFVLKADVASSEGANNVELVKLYCDLNPFETREKKADPRVRSGIYGFPIVLFWNNTKTGETKFMG